MLGTNGFKVVYLGVDVSIETFVDAVREQAAGTRILSLDNSTDIRTTREVLGDNMCMMGDVPPALLSSDTPEQVLEHCRDLIRDSDPSGCILQSGCDIPVDAPLENVKAMADAAEAPAE